MVRKHLYSDLYQFLEEIRTRPGMYLPSRLLEDLETLLAGYQSALDAHNIEEFGTDFSKKFREYLWEKYRWSSPYGWAQIVADHCDGLEDAWDRFFELVDDLHEGAA